MIWPWGLPRDRMPLPTADSHCRPGAERRPALPAPADPVRHRRPRDPVTGILAAHGSPPGEQFADVGDITRLPKRVHFASRIGTVPIDASTGRHTRCRRLAFNSTVNDGQTILEVILQPPR